MERLYAILEDICPDVDYRNETNLIDGGVLDSFSIVSLIGAISETFDIEISPKYLVPENFNSVAAMWALITKIEEEE